MLSVFALGRAANHVGLPVVFIAAGMSILMASRWIRGKGSAAEQMEEESRLEPV
jgi:hypothetical protein